VVVPHFLGAHDHPWLHVLVDEYARFIGRRQRELDERLREPLPCASPQAKRRVAVHVLSRLWGSGGTTTMSPRCARAAVFAEAARSQAEPAVVVASVAAQLGVRAAELTEALFADLPGERLVAAPTQLLAPGELALRTNLAIAQAFLSRSAAVLIEMEGERSRRGPPCEAPGPHLFRGARWRWEPGGSRDLGAVCSLSPDDAVRARVE
jgi:predicted nuclease of restriction endonuclease-like RecB superfamily